MGNILQLLDTASFLAIAMAVFSFVLCILGLMGKDIIILHSRYTNATEEERATMNKKAYRAQGIIICFLLGVVSLLNALTSLLQMPQLRTVAAGIAALGIIYAIISSRALKK